MIDTIREFSDVKGLIVVADGTNLNQGTVSGGVAWSGEKKSWRYSATSGTQKTNRPILYG